MSWDSDYVAEPERKRGRPCQTRPSATIKHVQQQVCMFPLLVSYILSCSGALTHKQTKFLAWARQGMDFVTTPKPTAAQPHCTALKLPGELLLPPAAFVAAACALTDAGPGPHPQYPAVPAV